MCGGQCHTEGGCQQDESPWRVRSFGQVEREADLRVDDVVADLLALKLHLIERHRRQFAQHACNEYRGWSGSCRGSATITW